MLVTLGPGDVFGGLLDVLRDLRLGFGGVGELWVFQWVEGFAGFSAFRKVASFAGFVLERIVVERFFEWVFFVERIVVLVLRELWILGELLQLLGEFLSALGELFSLLRGVVRELGNLRAGVLLGLLTLGLLRLAGLLLWLTGFRLRALFTLRQLIVFEFFLERIHFLVGQSVGELLGLFGGFGGGFSAFGELFGSGGGAFGLFLGGLGELLLDALIG